MAAKRANINDIILSKANEKDIKEIKEEYIKDLKFHYVTNMLDVIDLALLKNKVKNALNIVYKEVTSKQFIEN